MAELLTSNIGNGVSSFTVTNLVLNLGANANGFSQVALQNRNVGTNASGDFVLTTDTGNNTFQFLNFGINGSKYSDPTFNVVTANDAYIYSQNSNLAIGVSNVNSNLDFFAGSTVAGNEAMIIYGSNLNIQVKNTMSLMTENVSHISLPTFRANLQPSPVANTLKIFSRDVGGRFMLTYMGPSGLDAVVQPFLGTNQIRLWQWIGNATTTALAMGMAAPTATGTATTRTVAATNLFRSLKRIGYLSAATAGSNAAIRMNQTQFLRGNTAGQGGWHACFRFGISDPAVVAGAMMFMGFTPTTGQIANATNVAAMTNVCGIGQIATSNNLQIITNLAQATAYMIDTGLRCNVGNTNVWDVQIFTPPNGSTVGFRIIDQANTANVYMTTITANSTNLPAANTLLAWQQWRTNNTAASVVGLDFISTYIETDN